jgi:hypothetical protein
VDERLVMPETRFEAIAGEVVYVSPSDQPHGSRHSKLSALLEAYAAHGYDAASDMLTRTSEREDMAPDGSIYPMAPDPETGGRQLEELAFEVVSTERLAACGVKAASLLARGVRRIFAVDVARQRALEWSARTGTWEILPAQGKIEDRALALPLPVYDLVSAAKADDAVARALLAKRNPVLMQVLAEQRADGQAEGEVKGRLDGEVRGRLEGEAKGRLEGEAKGRLEGKIESLLSVLAAREIPVSAAEERHVRATRDEATLDRWLGGVAKCLTAAELLESERAAVPRAVGEKARKRGSDGTTRKRASSQSDKPRNSRKR